MGSGEKKKKKSIAQRIISERMRFAFSYPTKFSFAIACDEMKKRQAAAFCRDILPFVFFR